jgi:5-methylthioadenosine/S-adenosylhomocysteine deaminase
MRDRRPDLVLRRMRVLTCDAAWTDHREADIVIDGGRIVEVGPGVADTIPYDPSDVSGANLLALPGLVNTHFHSSGNLLKGAVANQPLELFMLYEVPPFMEHPVSSRFAYTRTMLGAAEMLRQGVTAVHDDAFFLPIATQEEITAIMTAYADSGLRATVALDQPNLVEYDKHAFLADLLPPDIRDRMDRARRQDGGELADLYRWFISSWHEQAGGRLRSAVSCSAPQRVTAEYFRFLGDLSREHEIPYNMHILETRSQRVFRSLVRYAHDHGVLDHRSQVIHAIWIDDDDIALLADSGAGVAHNPVANLKIGSGIMPWRRLRDASIPIGIGTDEATVDDGVNLWTALKTAGLIHNVTDPDYGSWPGPTEILRAATAGGARAMGLAAPAGVIEPGALADLAILDLDTLPFTPLNDLARQLVYCEPARSVDTVIVDGKVVVRRGELLTIDMGALLASVRSLQDEIDGFVAACRRGAQQVGPLYDLAYRKGLTLPVSVDPWAGGHGDAAGHSEPGG